MFKVIDYRNVALLLICFVMPLQAAEEPAATKKQTITENYLNASEAYKLAQQEGDKLLFIDVRTPEELLFVGHPKHMDMNIPFLRMDYSQWDSKQSSFKKKPNKKFTFEVEAIIKAKQLNKSAPIIFICRSGVRSAAAANKLASMGYKKVYTVIDGFEGDKAKQGENKGKRVVNGWKNADLPWEYKLSQEQFSMR